MYMYSNENKDALTISIQRNQLEKLLIVLLTSCNYQNKNSETYFRLGYTHKNDSWRQIEGVKFIVSIYFCIVNNSFLIFIRKIDIRR